MFAGSTHHLLPPLPNGRPLAPQGTSAKVLFYYFNFIFFRVMLIQTIVLPDKKQYVIETYTENIL